MARILVIDDEESARYTIEQYLQADGHDVVLAHNGDNGLDLYADGEFKLAIVDMYMPRLGGLETIQALRYRNRTMPIIAVSGGGHYRRLEPLVKSMEVGATDRILKPFTKDQLLDAVRKALQ